MTEELSDNELGSALSIEWRSPVADVELRGVTTRLMRFARLATPLVRRSRTRRIAAVSAVFVVGSAGAAAAVAPHGFRIGGIEVFVDEAKTETPLLTRLSGPGKAPVSTAGSSFSQPTIPSDVTTWPGEPVTLEEANRRYRSRVRLPTKLRGPKAVFWMEPPKSGQITAVWSPSRQLPPTNDPRVGLLFTQFRGTARTEPVLIKKEAPSAAVESVRVNTMAGTWISGPHVVVIVDDSGERRDERRMAGNTLIWADGTYTYRMEGNFSKADALLIAKSVK